MIRYGAIAILYALGAFVSAGYYHRDATDRCFSNVYGKTVAVAIIWPLMAPQIMLDGLEGGCLK